MRSARVAMRRLAYLLTSWGAVGAAYELGRRCGKVPVRVPGVWLDYMIVFHDWAIWPYLSFFLFVPFAFATAPATRLPWLALSLQACALVCAVAFILLPTTVGIGPPPGAPPLLVWLARVDTPANCLPSLHGALSVLCAWAVCHAQRPVRTLAVLAWAAVICWSAVALRRHMVLDMGAGMALGGLLGLSLLPARRWGRW